MATHSVEPGVVLADRYALEDLLSEEGEATTWRARDQVLARSVVLQIIPSPSPAAAEMLSAAKAASRVADPRILQVLDAVDDGELSYVVREWTNGQSLEVVLTEGPMPARKATFLMHEVSGAISTAHRVGLRHQRLAPDTIILTKSSGIKVLGLGTLAALRTDPAEMDDPELADTRDLGRLLYACLTARWPGGSAGTLPAAPTEHGKLLRPRQVRAGVPRSLDGLCDRILGNPPRSGDPIKTVDEVKAALSAILTTDGLSEAAGLQMASPDRADDAPARPEPPPAVLSTDDPRVWTPDRIAAMPPHPLVPKQSSQVGRTLRWVVLLVLGIGIMLLLYLMAIRLPMTHDVPAFVEQPSKSHSTKTKATQTTPTASVTTPVAVGPLEIVSAQSFDPLPQGSGDENPERAQFAIDGNPATYWSTVVYFSSATFGDSKDGVGLLLDLGADREVRSARVTLIGSPTSLELRAAPAGTTTAPTASADDYAVISTLNDVGTQARFTLDQPVTTRFLLLWITSMPEVPTGYQGKVAEIQVLG